MQEIKTMIPSWLLLKLSKEQRADTSFMARLITVFTETAKREIKVVPEMLTIDESDLDTRILTNLTAIKELAPTLYPGKSLPYTKIGLLNIARRKQVKYEHNIAELEAIKQDILVAQTLKLDVLTKSGEDTSE
ncbi:MAG: hypothetical protein V1767_00860 [Chloroflexota bacterium]